MKDELAIKQVEVLLDMHSKRLHDEIRQLKEELSRVREDLKEIKEVRHVRQDPPAQTQVPAAVPVPTAQPEAPPQAFQPQTDATAPIDRNGVAPSDVAIEKIFYSGSR